MCLAARCELERLLTMDDSRCAVEDQEEVVVVGRSLMASQEDVVVSSVWTIERKSWVGSGRGW